jgi:hypothetical protein
MTTSLLPLFKGLNPYAMTNRNNPFEETTYNVQAVVSSDILEDEIELSLRFKITEDEWNDDILQTMPGSIDILDLGVDAEFLKIKGLETELEKLAVEYIQENLADIKNPANWFDE